MRLLLILGILFGMVFSGGASATTYQPATTFTGDVDLNSHYVTDVAKDAGIGVTVGFTSDCDYVCDGTDDNVQIQQAIDYLSSVGPGGTVWLQMGDYNVTSKITFDNALGITLCGENDPLHIQTYPTQTSRIQITDTVDNAFYLSDGCMLKNLEFFYPNQVTNTTPVVYPATIALKPSVSNLIRIEHCYAPNPYYFIDATVSHWYLVVKDVAGGPLMYGIKEDNCWAGSYYHNVHFSPDFYNVAAGDVLLKWVADNGYAFHITKSDWVTISDCFQYGYKYAYYFYNTEAPTLTDCNADVCVNPIYMNGVTRASIRGCDIVQKHATDGWVTGIGIYLDGGSDSLITNNRLRCGCNGMAIDAARTIVSDNQFVLFNQLETADHYGVIVSTVEHVIVTCNIFNGNNKANTKGVWLYNSCKNTKISDNIFVNCINGIAIDTGCVDFEISNNRLDSSPLSDNSGSVSKRIINNLGLNPVGHIGPPSVPASTVAYTNTYGYPCTVAITGGTVTIIAIGGVASNLTPPCSVVVAPGETITLTYSNVPTWVWYGL